MEAQAELNLVFNVFELVNNKSLLYNTIPLMPLNLKTGEEEKQQFYQAPQNSSNQHLRQGNQKERINP